VPASAQLLVERFYLEVWNHCDERLAREILHPALEFRGSLGTTLQGVEGFIGYLRAVHRTLGDYRCQIEDLIANETRAAARMRFGGLHREPLLGYPATHKPVSWPAGAFFSTDGDRITRIWVIADLDALTRQLAA
jgi:steroid delta-isomerase-like uncharacterized protein